MRWTFIKLDTFLDIMLSIITNIIYNFIFMVLSDSPGSVILIYAYAIMIYKQYKVQRLSNALLACTTIE